MYSVCMPCAENKKKENRTILLFLVTLAHDADLDKAKHSRELSLECKHVNCIKPQTYFN